MIVMLRESFEDDANRLLDEVETLSAEVFEVLSDFTQSEDVFVEIQYNSEAFSKVELIRNYLNKIKDYAYSIGNSMGEDY